MTDDIVELTMPDDAPIRAMCQSGEPIQLGPENYAWLDDELVLVPIDVSCLAFRVAPHVVVVQVDVDVAEDTVRFYDKTGRGVELAYEEDENEEGDTGDSSIPQ